MWAVVMVMMPSWRDGGAADGDGCRNSVLRHVRPLVVMSCSDSIPRCVAMIIWIRPKDEKTTAAVRPTTPSDHIHLV